MCIILKLTKYMQWRDNGNWGYRNIEVLPRQHWVKSLKGWIKKVLKSFPITKTMAVKGWRVM